MKLQAAVSTYRTRKAWVLRNDVLELVVLQGGGHLARLALHAAPKVNPLWQPAWRTIEPWQFQPGRAAPWDGSRLLASISGHLLCLGTFGSPSAAEAALGMDGHGEAPIARWRLLDRGVTARHARLHIGCELPRTGMRAERVLTVRPGSHLVEIVTTVTSTVDRDLPFTMCEHSSIGEPFVEKGVTFVDLSARAGRTYPTVFGRRQRLRVDTAFTWPDGPGVAGDTVDLRTIDRRRRGTSDFSAQQMDPEREDAWACAGNPKLGVLLAYHWRRKDFPWVGNWEENFCRTTKPWSGRSLVRGIEFANTPFPTTLEQSVALGKLHGERTYGWLPARGSFRTSYRVALLPLDRRARGVSDIRAAPDGLDVDVALQSHTRG